MPTSRFQFCFCSLCEFSDALGPWQPRPEEGARADRNARSLCSRKKKQRKSRGEREHTKKHRKGNTKEHKGAFVKTCCRPGAKRQTTSICHKLRPSRLWRLVRAYAAQEMGGGGAVRLWSGPGHTSQQKALKKKAVYHTQAPNRLARLHTKLLYPLSHGFSKHGAILV